MGTKLPPRKGAQQPPPPLFGPCLLCPNGRPSQQLLNSCTFLLMSPHPHLTGFKIRTSADPQFTDGSRNISRLTRIGSCKVYSESVVNSRHYTEKACAYSCKHRLWRHAGVGEFGETPRSSDVQIWWRINIYIDSLMISGLIENARVNFTGWIS